MPGIGSSRSVRIPATRTASHFGRREQTMSTDAVTALIVEQVAFLVEMAADAGVPIRFLKPHGALYNQAQHQNEIARGVVDAAAELSLPLLGQPGTALERLASGRGVRYIAEGFPDRRYRDDGSLVPRSEPDAILHNPAEMEQQLLHLVEGGRVATLCIHGDDPRPSTTPSSSAGCSKGRGSVCRASPRIPDDPNRLPDPLHRSERPDSYP